MELETHTKLMFCGLEKVKDLHLKTSIRPPPPKSALPKLSASASSSTSPPPPPRVEYKALSWGGEKPAEQVRWATYGGALACLKRKPKRQPYWRYTANLPVENCHIGNLEAS